jgi:hypothetical protein
VEGFAQRGVMEFRTAVTAFTPAALAATDYSALAQYATESVSLQPQPPDARIFVG